MNGYPPGIVIKVHSDYGGYFENAVKNAVWQRYNAHKLKHTRFEITAEAYRGCTIEWIEHEDDPSTLHLYFYSPCRNSTGPLIYESGAIDIF